MPRGSKKQKDAGVVRETPSYVHPEAQVLLRPEVGKLLVVKDVSEAKKA